MVLMPDADCIIPAVPSVISLSAVYVPVGANAVKTTLFPETELIDFCKNAN